MVFWIW